MYRTNPLTLMLALVLSVAAAPVAAQGTEARPDLPEGWLMRFDRAAATPDMVSFESMSPGWHVTTGGAGAGIFWQPAMEAEGEYGVHGVLHLMRPAEHPEAFGLFMAGRDLEADGQSYVYFLVRQDGHYLIKQRHGSETETLVDWTAHDAVPTASADESTAYTLDIEVGVDQIAFSVNGSVVETLQKEGLATDGIAGVRINHRLDVHIEELELDPEG